MATRLVADELDFNLATLAAALLIIVIVILGDAGARTLDAAILGGGSVTIADVRIVELGWGGLVVLISDVGHFGIWDNFCRE